jgi:hypothetical protein
MERIGQRKPRSRAMLTGSVPRGLPFARPKLLATVPFELLKRFAGGQNVMVKPPSTVITDPVM